jgi:hypothetical protein
MSLFSLPFFWTSSVQFSHHMVFVTQFQNFANYKLSIQYVYPLQAEQGFGKVWYHLCSLGYVF